MLKEEDRLQRVSQSRLGCFFLGKKLFKKVLKRDPLYRDTFETLWAPKGAQINSFNKSKAGHFLKIKKWTSKADWSPIGFTGPLLKINFARKIY